MLLRWLCVVVFFMLGVFSVVVLGKDKQFMVIVVGVGLVGLSVVYELQKDGWQVMVFEVWLQVGGCFGLVISEWVGNQKVQFMFNVYLDIFKLKLVLVLDFVCIFSYLIDGLYYSSSDFVFKQLNVVVDFKCFELILDDFLVLIFDLFNFVLSNILFVFDQMNVVCWLDKLNLLLIVCLLVNQCICLCYDELLCLLLFYFVQQGCVYCGVDDCDLCVVCLFGGSQVLVEVFVKQIKMIKIKFKVLSIVQVKDGVVVKVGSEIYKVDYVVFVVLLKVFGQIQMILFLSGIQMFVLKGINYGWCDQILLKFKCLVWDDKLCFFGEIFSDQGLGMIWVELVLKGGVNVLINLFGDNVCVLQVFGDWQMVDQVLICMNKFYLKMCGVFVGYEICCYSVDLGIGGFYLVYGLGQVMCFWWIWEQLLLWVVFVGEYIDVLYFGIIEGVLCSGKCVVSQVCDLYVGKMLVIEGVLMVVKVEKVVVLMIGGEKKNLFVWFICLFD